MVFGKKIASSVIVFGLFWICIFGEWHTVRAYGDDSSIYLVDFDETAYDMYLQGYYPADYTYEDFVHNSIQSLTSHYVATDNNNFGAIVDTIEQDVLLNGWDVIDDFFEDAWIDLKTGLLGVAQGFTDDFKHELDGRFKTSGTTINGHHWEKAPATWSLRQTYGNYTYNCSVGNGDIYYTTYGYSDVNFARGVIFCSVTSYTSQQTGSVAINRYYSGSIRTGYYGTSQNANASYGVVSCSGGFSTYEYASSSDAIADFFGHPIVDGSSWTGVGYYSDTPANYSINLPALPVVDWQSISNNNKTKYGVDFPDVNVSVDFQLPDRYYPQSVTYDTPYWLINDDSEPWSVDPIDWQAPELPTTDLQDGNAIFFQTAFEALPIGIISLILGVLICLLLFTIL